MLYLNQGSLWIPDANSESKITILPYHYFNFEPYDGCFFFGANLPNVTEGRCTIFFVYGYKEIINLYPDFFFELDDYIINTLNIVEYIYEEEPEPPSNAWTFNRSGTQDIFSVYNNGVGNVGQFSGANWVRNTGVDTRKIIIYANFPANVWLERLQIQCGFTFNPSFPLSVKVRLYSAPVSAGGLGSNVQDCIEFIWTVGAIGTPYISSLGSIDYLVLQEAAAISIELNNGSPNTCSIQDIIICGRGDYPFTTPDAGSCVGNISSGFYFSNVC